ncbi:unnamed protein product [Allacma fusca]|uniref:Cadherin domain-containing protein n=1 Tax=Allacma fusca TaxID=39272 RepID=A0A8J2P9A1_9HEXA|nr:unnamed protein product [Allacma fusca]
MKAFFWIFVFILGCRANNPPYFVADLNNHVLTENTPIGTIVYTLKAVDPENSPLRFGLMGTDKLAVDEKSGDVTIAKPIDRETASHFKLKVTVEDVVASGENNIVTVPVVVTVLDQNDNPPHFQNQSAFEAIEVSEETRIGSRILSVSLTDPDMSGLALTLHCTPSQQTPEACEVFPVEIKESTAGHLRAEIRLAMKLDYKKRSLYRFTLSSTDGEHTTTAKVLIKVHDVQNTAPEFTGSMSGRISEDAVVGALVMIIQARDGDIGKPREVKLSLLSNPGDAFQLDSRTGYLTTTRPLDREILGSVLTMQIKAQEVLHSEELSNNQRSENDVTQTLANVTVLIDDVNDFAPRFNRKEFWTDIDENTAVGTPLANVDMEIVDLDTGTFADFTLKIDGPLAEVFDIEPKFASGSARPVIRIKKSFDYENPNERKFLILVIAQNVEEPQLFSTSTIIVGINDLNDNSPVFEKPVYTLTIPESSKPGTRIGSIIAQDPDSKEFGTEGIMYQLVGSGSKKFYVNSKTGDIFISECPSTTATSTNVTVASCLDYETQKSFDMLYMASDNNKEDGFIHSIVPLKIILTDSNDERPTFPQKFERTVEENSRQFEPKFFVKALDVDKTAVLAYRLMDPVPPHFKIDPNTGEMIIKGPELPPGNYSFRVEATDGVFKANTLVAIKVNDINNNNPVFDPEITEKQITIPEKVPVGSVVAQIKADDADFDANGEVHYSIDKGSFGYFEVDPLDGEITLVKKLDSHEKDKFDLTVAAEDNGTPSLRTTTTIHLTIERSYLKLPKFSPRTQRVQVSESARPGDVVHQITTIGGDTTPTSLKFQFVQPVEARNVDNKAVTDLNLFPDWFDLDPSGQVVVKGQLERDIVISLNYTIMLSSDESEPGVREFGVLVLTLFEVNDLPPRVEDMEIEIEEELPPGMSILTLEAEDPEGGSISNYFVKDGADYISVDNKTGEIKVAGRLDFEDRPLYNFTVVAVDSGVPQLSSTATIAIHLVNINDNTPVFNQSEYVAEIDEHSAEGVWVANVFASDADGDVVSYEIQPGPYSKAFKVDRLGRVTVSKEGAVLLDRETLSFGSFVLGIGAKDSVHIGYSKIIVNLRDVNDVIPTMDQKNYHVIVYAPLNSMQQLLRVSATGGDLPETDQISYSIVSGNEEGIFNIDPTSGIIRADRAYAKSGDYRLVVEVTDSETELPAHFDRSGVLISVLPGNFRRPEFTFPNKVNWTLLTMESNLQELEEFAKGGKTKHIGQVLAFDGDEGAAGKISFYFKEGDNLITETEKFRIETDTGKIIQIQPLDREQMNAYNLVVVAKDGGTPVSAMNQYVLTIQVQDIDDHQPKFIQRNYNFTIKENSPEGTSVGQVEALDEDEGGNAQIFYFLASDEKNKYKNEDIRVDIKTGRIVTKKILDRERIDEYQLYIRASPSPIFNKTAQTVTAGEAARDNSIAFVIIKVLDENDNPVRFQQKQYFAGINSGAEPGREILTMTTKDIDSSSDNTVQYNLLASNLILEDFKSGGSVIPSPFRIDEHTGRLTISPAAMRQYSGGSHRFLIKVGAKETIAPYYEDTAQVHVWVVEDWQEVILTVKSPPEEMLKEQLIEVLSNITDSLVLINKIAPHVNEDLTVNPNWSDVFVTSVDKKTSVVIPIGVFLQAIDVGHDRLRQSDSPMELYSAVPAMGAADPDGEYFFNNRDSFDTAFAGLVALVALLCMGVAAILALCCCLHRYNSRGSESEKLQGGMKYPLHHPSDSIPGTPALGRHSQQPDMMEDLATDNPLWIDHKIKTYEEQELTMQVASEMDTTNNTDDGRSLNGSGRMRPLPRTTSPQFSNAYATLHPHPRPPPTLNYDELNILGKDTVAVHL